MRYHEILNPVIVQSLKTSIEEVDCISFPNAKLAEDAIEHLLRVNAARNTSQACCRLAESFRCEFDVLWRRHVRV
jgi:hypothetical protein